LNVSSVFLHLNFQPSPEGQGWGRFPELFRRKAFLFHFCSQVNTADPAARDFTTAPTVRATKCAFPKVDGIKRISNFGVAEKQALLTLKPDMSRVTGKSEVIRGRRWQTELRSVGRRSVLNVMYIRSQLAGENRKFRAMQEMSIPIGVFLGLATQACEDFPEKFGCL
jgi:hypothetical protein